MTVKELVLNSLETFDKFKIQYSHQHGKVKELMMNKELYERVADKEIEHFYLDTDSNKQPYISLKLK